MNFRAKNYISTFVWQMNFCGIIVKNFGANFQNPNVILLSRAKFEYEFQHDN